MKIDFDKFSLSQKIYSIIGLISAVAIYMNDKDYLNVALGIAFLTAIVVFLLKYKIMKVIFNVAVFLCVATIALFLIAEFTRSQHEERELVWQNEPIKENYYCAVIKERLDSPQDGIESEHIIKCPSQESCLQQIKTHNENEKMSVISANCEQVDGRLNRIFNNQPIYDWYIRIDRSYGYEQAYVFRYRNLYYKFLAYFDTNRNIESYIHSFEKSLMDYGQEKGIRVNTHIVPPQGVSSWEILK